MIDEKEIRQKAEEIAAKQYVTPVEQDIRIIYQAICVGINMGLEKAKEVYGER